MNVAFFGWIRVRRASAPLICVQEMWFNDRHSLWEQSLDRLRDLLTDGDDFQAQKH
jgi:hypothetical protein